LFVQVSRHQDKVNNGNKVNNVRLIMRPNLFLENVVAVVDFVTVV
jgi:hypothetical protein